MSRLPAFRVPAAALSVVAPTIGDSRAKGRKVGGGSRAAQVAASLGGRCGILARIPSGPGPEAGRDRTEGRCRRGNFP